MSFGSRPYGENICFLFIIIIYLTGVFTRKYCIFSLVKFIQNYIRDPNGILSISSLVRILMMSFPTFSQLFVQTVNEKWWALDLCNFIIKRKLHSGLKI